MFIYISHHNCKEIYMSSAVIKETVFSVENNFTEGDNIIATQYRQ